MRRHLLEQLARRSNILQRLDARTKLVCALFLILLAVLLPVEVTWPFLAYLFLLAALCTLAGIPLGALLVRAAWIAPFLLAATFLLPFVPRAGSRVTFSIALAGHRIAVYQDGLILAKGILLKAAISTFSVLLLAATTPFNHQLSALAALGLPRLALTVLSLLYRYLFLLQDELARVMRAAAARNWRSGSPALRLRAAGGILGSLFLRAHARGERVHAAMLSRGYEESAVRPQPGSYRWSELLPGGGFIAITAGIFAAARLLA
jgi:cobalt/nickel transport system permease protein